ncbi:MAG: DUF2284 domain-containing protein [Clostridiales bacterium]|nr:DUF2284 domain-containing protein [Clostridiales bacterium]
MDEAQILQLALDCGAHQASWIDIRKDGVFNTVFRDICASNACGQYGMCHMCPPDVGDIEKLIATARSFDRGLLYQTVDSLEDSFDIEGMMRAGQAHNDCANRIRDSLAGMDGLMHLSTGGCKMCERCTKRDGRPCAFPDLAMSSLEAYGMDVYNTARNAGLRYHHGPNTVTYFGMVLMKSKPDA